MQILILLVVALVFRFFLSSLGFHVDILTNAGWGQWIYNNGPLGFYSNSVWIYSWPTQPPFVSLLYGFDNWLYIFLLETFRDMGNIIVQYHLAPGHMRWWFTFTKWFDTAKATGESVFSLGYLVSIKILPILADLGIAAVIYKIAKSIKTIKYPVIWPAVYLFSPFSWYLSALWGQYDQLAFLPVLAAFILESRKKLPWLTPFLFAVGIAVKPTSLVLVPIFIYLYLKNSHKKINWMVSVVLIAAFFVTTTKVFTDQNVIEFTRMELYQKVFLKSDSRLSTNSFNFWRLLMTEKTQNHHARFLFVPAYIWSILAFITLNIIAFRKIKKINTQNVISSMFIVTAGSWLFMTNMLDRYFFAGVVSGLILCIYNKKLFKYWLIMSLIFALNLYNQWWFPDMLDSLKKILVWQNGFVTKVLSVINILIFLRIMIMLRNHNRTSGD